MYDDKKQTFSIKDIILQLLFIILLVFVLIWLFPTKGYLEKKLDGIENGVGEKLKPLYVRLFTDNILTMKDAAKSYFTNERLPQYVGDKVTMTLQEMYDESLLLELIDSNGNACDANKSYVEVTKVENEYELKISLNCSDKEAYVIEHMGCYDYCNGAICSKKPTPTPKPAATKYKYQYVLTVGGTCTDFGAWSDWTTNKIEANSNTKVDTKVEKVFDHYEQVYGVVDTKYHEEYYNEDVYYGYSTETKAVGSKWVKTGTTSSQRPLSSTSTTRYTETGRNTELECNNSCKSVTTYYYNVEKLQTQYEQVKTCPGGSDTGSGCVKTVTKSKTVAELVYGYKDGDPVYKNVTYYRSATRTCTEAKTTYEWSTSNNDAALKAKGYTLTGTTQKI